MATTSMLNLYSYGRVAANKPLTANGKPCMTIEVTPVESLTMLDGEITDNISTDIQKGIDADGASFESTTSNSATVTARWLPFSSNRRTAPDVRRGEKVCIWKYADDDRYYWSSLEYEDHLRKLETIIWSISDTQDEGAEPSDQNTYFLVWSTHSKLIQLHTSTSDGEAVGYDFIFNTKESTVQLTDTMDNTFFLDSLARRLVLRTGSDAYIDLNDTDLNINVPGNMTTIVGGSMSFKSGGGTSLDAGGGFITKAPNVDFITPKTTTTALLETGGNTTIGGALSLAAGMTTGAGGSGGNIQLNGNLTSTGSGTFSGRVDANNID